MTERAQPAPAASDGDAALFRRVTLHILPILLLSYVIAYIDRVSIGIAKLKMLSDLNFSDAVYGFGAGVFFLGFTLFEIPSNLVLHRVGARVWIARIMVTWGVITILTMFVSSPLSFYALRFLLGAAEAGFVPGAIYYLTRWYPQARQGRIFSSLIVGAPIGGILVGPLSGWMMASLDGVAGLHNWQWLFLLQGLPAVAMGIVVLTMLVERPEDASWLSPAQKARISALIAADAARAPRAPDVGSALREPRIWLIGLVMVAVNLGIYAGVFWTPTMIKAAGVVDFQAIGPLSALPYVGAMIAMIGLGRSSDRVGERRWHIAFACLVAAGGLVVSGAFIHDGTTAAGGIMLSTAMLIGLTPVVWALASQFITGKAAAVGFALINVLGAVGGFLGPFLMGLAQDYTGNTAVTAYLIAGCTCIAAVIVIAATSRPPAAKPGAPMRRRLARSE